MNNTRHLDIGCGNRIRNPYQAMELYGVDFESDLPAERFRKADLSLDPLPFDTGFFDSVSAYDVLEHIPRVVCVSAPEAASGMKKFSPALRAGGGMSGSPARENHLS